MTDRLSEALKQVRDILQEEDHEHCAAVDVTFNSQGYELNYRMRSPGGLKRDGISMRNLKGDFIGSAS